MSQAIRVTVEESTFRELLPILNLAVSAALAALTGTYVYLTRKLATESVRARLAAQTPQVTISVIHGRLRANVSGVQDLGGTDFVPIAELNHVHVEVTIRLLVVNHGPGPATFTPPHPADLAASRYQDNVEYPWIVESVLMDRQHVELEYKWMGTADNLPVQPKWVFHFQTGNRVSETIDTHLLTAKITTIRRERGAHGGEGLYGLAGDIEFDTQIARTTRSYKV